MTGNVQSDELLLQRKRDKAVNHAASQQGKVSMIYGGDFTCPICKLKTAGQRDQKLHAQCVDTIGGKKKWKKALIASQAAEKAQATGDIVVDVEEEVQVEMPAGTVEANVDGAEKVDEDEDA